MTKIYKSNNLFYIQLVWLLYNTINAHIICRILNIRLSNGMDIISCLRTFKEHVNDRKICL